MRIAWLYSPTAYGRHRAQLRWDSLEDTPSGLTGSDSVAVNYARELAALGHHVVLFCHGAPTTAYDGVAVCPYTDWEEMGPEARGTFDIAVTLSHPDPLGLADPRTLRVCERQVSRFGIDSHEYQTWGFDKWVDLYCCPSEHAKLHVSSGAPHPEKFRVMPNGVDPRLFGGVEKTPGSVAYCSSPDRGLHLLLSIWPEIRRRVPGAVLEIAYQGLRNWVDFHSDAGKRMAGWIDEECSRRAKYVREALRRLAGHGVRVHDQGLSHRELAGLLSRSECLAFPCSVLAHTETFSVATLDAAAAGAVPVISDADCLAEVHGGAAVVVRDVERNLGRFTDQVVRVLTDREFTEEMRGLGREHAREHDWRTLAKRFESMLLEGLERKRTQKGAPGDTSRVNPGSLAERLAAGESVRYRNPSHPERGILEFHPVVAAPDNRVKIDLILTKYASGEEPIDVEHPFDSNSGGGCRAGFMGLVKSLPKLGYDVRAWSNFKVPGVFGITEEGFVEYRQWPQDWQPGTPLPFEPRDVLLCYYATFPLQGVPGGKTLRVASHHTYQLPFPGTYEWADLNLAPSQHAVDSLRAIYGGEWAVMPNAVQPDLPEWRPVPGRCVWHTSASRGLWNVLEAWPEIRSRVPFATLHVVGDVAGWLAHYEGRHDRQAVFADRVRTALSAMAPDVKPGPNTGLWSSIKFLGKLPRREVLRELSEAACFPFTAELVAPAETFSVSVAECLAIGVPVVLNPLDAMRGIYVDSPEENVVFNLPDMSRSTIASWVQMALEVNTGTGGAHRKRYGTSFTFERKARALDAAIRKALGSR